MIRHHSDKRYDSLHVTIGTTGVHGERSKYHGAHRRGEWRWTLAWRWRGDHHCLRLHRPRWRVLVGLVGHHENTSERIRMEKCADLTWVDD